MIFKEKYDSDLYVTGDCKWSYLKYGYCSYFALAYAELKGLSEFRLVMEYDSDVEGHYLVHVFVIENELYVDAEGLYTHWRDGVREITDIEFMELYEEECESFGVVDLIEKDMGFNQSFFDEVKRFIEAKYLI